MTTSPSDVFDDRERTKTPGCTCDLELSFGVEYLEDGTFNVLDAECETIAVCREEKHAKLVAAALNKMDNGRTEVCLIHTRAWWTARIADFCARGIEVDVLTWRMPWED